MIQKRSIFITPAGRTGTAFLAHFLAQAIEDCDSFHEPDVFRTLRCGALRGHWFAVRHFGLYNYTLGKLYGRSSMRALFVARITGRR